jgi:hypothetical protein
MGGLYILSVMSDNDFYPSLAYLVNSITIFLSYFVVYILSVLALIKF